MKKNILPFVLLAAVLGAALPASAITTTLEYEDARETNTLAVLRSEIVAATNSIVTVETDPVWTAEKANYATTNALASYLPLDGSEVMTGNLQIGGTSGAWLSGVIGGIGLSPTNGTTRAIEFYHNSPESVGLFPKWTSGYSVAHLVLTNANYDWSEIIPNFSDLAAATNQALTAAASYTDSATNALDIALAAALAAKRDITDLVYPIGYTLPASALPVTASSSYDLSSYSFAVNGSLIDMLDANGVAVCSFKTNSLAFYMGDSSLRFNGSSGVYNSFPVLSYTPNGTLALVSDVSSATNSLAASIDFTPSNPTLVSTIESVSPQPGDYANVSNLAYSAVQPETETDPVWAAASPTITADIATNAADIAELQSTATFLYHIYSGSNAVFEVTNYNSQVHAPTARLLSLTNGAEYVCVWTETNGLSRIANAATNYTDSAILAATNRYAVRAWSATTSGLGADAPAETTWISTPTTVLAGGYEYTKTVTSAGQVWVLTQNGMTTLGPDSQSYLDISSGSGDSLIKIEKTDSYLVGVAATNITVSGSTVTISVPVVSANHPYVRYAASLEQPVTWYKEEDENLPAGVTVAWSGSSGAWVCTITTSASQGYFFFEFVQEGSTKITLGGSLDVTNGIYYNGVKYVPTVNGNKLEFIAE